MNEYINREAVEQVLRRIANGLSVGETNALEIKDVKALYKIKGAKEILNTVDNDLSFIPTADVQIMKYGRWDGYICSECNVCADYFVSGDFYFDEKPNFCPNCGARMGGDAE